MGVVEHKPKVNETIFVQLYNGDEYSAKFIGVAKDGRYKVAPYRYCEFFVKDAEAEIILCSKVEEPRINPCRCVNPENVIRGEFKKKPSKKVKAYIGDHIFFKEKARDGRDEAEIRLDPDVGETYVRYVKRDHADEECEILMAELGVDSYVIPELYQGSVIFYQKPKYLSEKEDEEGNPVFKTENEDNGEDVSFENVGLPPR